MEAGRDQLVGAMAANKKPFNYRLAFLSDGLDERLPPILENQNDSFEQLWEYAAHIARKKYPAA